MLVSIAGALPFTMAFHGGGGAGVDDVARSLFCCYSHRYIPYWMGAGIVFFLGIKQKTI